MFNFTIKQNGVSKNINFFPSNDFDKTQFNKKKFTVAIKT